MQNSRANIISKIMAWKWLKVGSKENFYETNRTFDMKLSQYFDRSTPTIAYNLYKLQEWGVQWFMVSYYFALEGVKSWLSSKKIYLQQIQLAEILHLLISRLSKNIWASLSQKDFSKCHKPDYDRPDMPNECPLAALKLYFSQKKTIKRSFRSNIAIRKSNWHC